MAYIYEHKHIEDLNDEDVSRCPNPDCGREELEIIDEGVEDGEYYWRDCRCESCQTQCRMWYRLIPAEVSWVTKYEQDEQDARPTPAFQPAHGSSTGRYTIDVDTVPMYDGSVDSLNIADNVADYLQIRRNTNEETRKLWISQVPYNDELLNNVEQKQLIEELKNLNCDNYFGKEALLACVLKAKHVDKPEDLKEKCCVLWCVRPNSTLDGYYLNVRATHY